jgi:hypothetical protein
VIPEKREMQMGHTKSRGFSTAFCIDRGQERNKNEVIESLLKEGLSVHTAGPNNFDPLP